MSFNPLWFVFRSGSIAQVYLLKLKQYSFHSFFHLSKSFPNPLLIFSLFFFSFLLLSFFPPLVAGAATDYFSLQGMIRNYYTAAFDSEIVIFWRKQNNPLEKFESPFPSTVKLLFACYKMGSQPVKPDLFSFLNPLLIY